MTVSGVEVIPGATRLIRSLRDMGYEFSTAVADIVDNSVEARSNVVRIEVVWNGEHSYVLIADNGNGMSPGQLREAMRYGAERDYDTEDLGKFGLGLKTASMSQCTKLTVASRQNPKRADVATYCWDLDHIGATNRWEILPVPTQNLPPEARQHLKETTGTVVIWERLDRILNYKSPDGEFARKNLMAMCRELEEHLAMVFHRFLAGEVRGRKLSIYINNNKIVPWDPFARSEEATNKLESVSIRVEGTTAKADIIVEPFVLPHQSKFSSTEAHLRASGPEKWNRQQGFYIYRADRLIQAGGWSGIRTLDEHLKLARIALSFSPRLDDAFKVNVAKMRVALPASIKEEVSKAIAPALRLANTTYRSSEKTPPARPPAPLPAARQTTTSGVTGTPTRKQSGERDTGKEFTRNGLFAGDANPPTSVRVNKLEEVGHLLVRVATAEEVPVLQRVLDRARLTFAEEIG